MAKTSPKSTTITISATTGHCLAEFCKAHGLKVGAAADSAIQSWLIGCTQPSSQTGTTSNVITHRAMIMLPPRQEAAKQAKRGGKKS